jgi:hypothetical protein
MRSRTKKARILSGLMLNAAEKTFSCTFVAAAIIIRTLARTSPVARGSAPPINCWLCSA